MEQCLKKPGASPQASPYFQYGPREIVHLKGKDKRLGAAIEEIGIIRRPIIPNPFTALISSIVSQQISKKAAATVWGRLSELLGSITPETIQGTDLAPSGPAACPPGRPRHQGHRPGSPLGPGRFCIPSYLEDQEIIARLSALPGVGVWTAEMLLIFSLNRLNVLSYNDLAIRRGIMKLYGHKELPRSRFERYRTRYSPYCSVASLYLWEISGQD